jgi:hypothetical protein
VLCRCPSPASLSPESSASTPYSSSPCSAMMCQLSAAWLISLHNSLSYTYTQTTNGTVSFGSFHLIGPPPFCS